MICLSMRLTIDLFSKTHPAPAVNSGCPAFTIMDFGMFPCPTAGIGCGAVLTPFLIQPKTIKS